VNALDTGIPTEELSNKSLIIGFLQFATKRFTTIRHEKRAKGRIVGKDWKDNGGKLPAQSSHQRRLARISRRAPFQIDISTISAETIDL